jgi:hypothetical protein
MSGFTVMKMAFFDRGFSKKTDLALGGRMGKIVSLPGGTRMEDWAIRVNFYDRDVTRVLEKQSLFNPLNVPDFSLSDPPPPETGGSPGSAPDDPCHPYESLQTGACPHAAETSGW